MAPRVLLSLLLVRRASAIHADSQAATVATRNVPFLFCDDPTAENFDFRPRSTTWHRV